MIVGPHSTKLPQSCDTKSDQLGVPAVLPENLVPFLTIEQCSGLCSGYFTAAKSFVTSEMYEL